MAEWAATLQQQSPPQPGPGRLLRQAEQGAKTGAPSPAGRRQSPAGQPPPLGARTVAPSPAGRRQSPAGQPPPLPPQQQSSALAGLPLQPLQPLAAQPPQQQPPQQQPQPQPQQPGTQQPPPPQQQQPGTQQPHQQQAQPLQPPPQIIAVAPSPAGRGPTTTRRVRFNDEPPPQPPPQIATVATSPAGRGQARGEDAPAATDEAGARTVAREDPAPGEGATVEAGARTVARRPLTEDLRARLAAIWGPAPTPASRAASMPPRLEREPPRPGPSSAGTRRGAAAKSASPPPLNARIQWPSLPPWFACPERSRQQWRPGTYAWRVMRGDYKDLEPRKLPQDGDIELVAMKAIHSGSQEFCTSPFLHATLSRSRAHNWLARAIQGQGPQKEDPKRVIDLSSYDKPQIFVGKRQSDVELVRLIHVPNSAPVLAESWQEVLILGRGYFPETFAGGRAKCVAPSRRLLQAAAPRSVQALLRGRVF